MKGKTGFAAALRVAITREENKTIVSYTNPAYWGNAYCMDNFQKVADQYKAVEDKLMAAMKATGTYVGKPFGSEDGISKGVPNVKKVYSVAIPGTDLKLYGVALSGENGENKFMPKIDIGSPKHTAFLPCEFLVMGKDVYMLHGRYRIALSFPDLTMGTFTKIMSTPGDIEDMIRSIVK